MEGSLVVTVALVAAVLFLLIIIAILALKLKWARRDAMHDGLTGLLNKRGFETFAEQQIALVGRNLGRNHEYEATLVYIDLNNFKPVNDLCGHRVGDEFLRKFAELLRTCFRGSDIIGRMGGDEFAVFLPRTNAEGAAHLVEKLNATMHATHFVIGEYPLDVDAAIGYAQATKGMSLRKLVAKADVRMYEAKRAGKVISLEPTTQSA